MRMVIYSNCGRLACTTEENYNARIQNARLIQNCSMFNSPMEIIEYYCKYFGSEPDDFIVKVKE